MKFKVIDPKNGNDLFGELVDENNADLIQIFSSSGNAEKAIRSLKIGEGTYTAFGDQVFLTTREE